MVRELYARVQVRGLERNRFAYHSASFENLSPCTKAKDTVRNKDTNFILFVFLCLCSLYLHSRRDGFDILSDARIFSLYFEVILSEYLEYSSDAMVDPIFGFSKPNAH